MLPFNLLQKPVRYFFVVLLLNGIFQPAFSQSANYEAAKWSTWFITNPEQIKVAAPAATTQLRSELQTIKDRVSKVDEKKLLDIEYWDAGAPGYRWNQIAPRIIPFDKIDVFGRSPSAWMNVAIYDATVLAWREKLKYKRKRPHQSDASIKTVVEAPLSYSYPCEHSVTAAAAAYVLAYFLPEKGDSLIKLARAASQSRIDAGVQFPSDAEAGWKLGEEVAKQIIEKARKDGSDKKWNGVVNKDPKKWTGPYPLGITLTVLEPMVLRSIDQFRPAPPPDFAADMKELKSLKQTLRTNSIAYNWANLGLGYWNDIASLKMFEHGISRNAPEAARIYAILHTAIHDGTIAVMDAKYAYWGIRPDQYDTTYKAIIFTPPFPGYPSGHAMGAGLQSAVLSYFFPEDAKDFDKRAQECADSRFYAGIHFRTDNEVGLQMGKQIGKFVTETMMKK